MVVYCDFNTVHHYYYVEEKKKDYVILSKNSKQIKQNTMTQE